MMSQKILNLKTKCLAIFEWFQNNYLKANKGKSQAMFTIDDKLELNVGGSLICNETIVKLLDVSVANKLSLSHI